MKRCVLGAQIKMIGKLVYHKKGSSGSDDAATAGARAKARTSAAKRKVEQTERCRKIERCCRYYYSNNSYNNDHR